MLDGEDVASHAAVGARAAPHLLAPRPGGFAGGAFATRQAGIFLELVNAIEPWRVGRGGQTAADAEAVYRRARSDDVRNHTLVDAAAGEDRDLLQSALIQDTAHLFRERDQVAAVETHTGDRNARSLEPGSERDDFARGRLGVVGVDEQDEIFRPRVREV